MIEKIVLSILILLFLLFAYWQYNGVVNDDFVFKQQQHQKRTLRQEAQSLWPLYQAQQDSVQMPSNTSASNASVSNTSSSNTSVSNTPPTKASLKDEITQDILAKIGWQAPKTANQQTDKNQNTANALANLINSINKQMTNANISNNEQKSIDLQPIPFSKAINFKANISYLKYVLIPVCIWLLIFITI